MIEFLLYLLVFSTHFYTFWAQSFTSLMADLRQDINVGFTFSIPLEELLCFETLVEGLKKHWHDTTTLEDTRLV